MAEFAASLVGLVSTAEVVLTRIYKYIKHGKHAEEEVLALSDDVSGLYGVLKRVELVIGSFNGVSCDAITDSRQIGACVTSLDRLRDKLAQFQEADDTNTRTLKKRWKWPFSRPETLELKAAIETYKSTLSLALSADNVTITLEALSKAQSIGKKVDHVQALLEAQARISLNKEKEEVLRTVGPHNPLQHHQTNVSLRHSGTGTWFIEGPQFQKWLHTRNAKMWVYGIPGAGKSILAAATISEALQLSDENNAIAYFYCDYKEAATQDPMHILGSLAEQIARQSEHSFERLAKFAKKQCSTDRLQTFSCSNQNFCELIMEMSNDFRNVIIVVDGMDECGDNIRTVMELLTWLGTSSSSIKVLLSSRDIVDIRDFLDDYEQVSIAATSVDLRLYVGAEIEARITKKSRKRLYITDPNLKGEIMDKLINGAKGMFRWVAVQLDYICDMGSDEEIRSALDSLPPDLFSSYKRLLLDINKKPLQSQLLAQRALKWIVGLGDIQPKALAEALSVKPGIKCLSSATVAHEDRIVQLCGSLIRRVTAGEYTHLESAHFTVKEFLASLKDSSEENLTSYCLDPMPDHKMFVIVAGNYLCCKEFAEPDPNWYYAVSAAPVTSGDLYPQYPFWELANAILLGWARDCLDDPAVFDPIKRLFCPSNDRARIVSLQARAIYLDQVFKPSCEVLDQFKFITPLHEAAMYALSPLCDYLLRDEDNCNPQSPLGTPLHCALLGSEQMLAVLDAGFLISADSTVEDVEPVEATVRVLISHGANHSIPFCHETRTGEQMFSAISLALFIHGSSGLGLVRILLDAGAVLCEQSLSQLQSIMESVDNSQVYSLIQAIEPANVGPELITQLSELKVRTFQKFEEDSESFPEQFVGILTDAQVGGRLFEKAIEYNKQRMVTSLLDNGKLKIDWQNEDGENAGHLAAKANSVEVLKLLLDRGVKHDHMSHHGRTPLHHAVEFGSQDSITLFLSHDLDFDALDGEGQTVLHLAALHNNQEALQLLQDASLLHGVLLNRRNDYGQTALMLAAEKGNVAIVESLLKAGADSEVKNHWGWTAIQSAVANGRLEVLHKLSQKRIGWKERCRITTDNEVVFYDLLLTHLAAVNGHKQCLEFLLALTPHFEIEDKACTYSLLWFAVYSRSSTTVQYLLDSGAELTTSASQWTPLHVAVDREHDAAVHMLLRHGHDVHVMNQQGETPMMIAWRRGCHRLFAALKRHEQRAQPTLDQKSENDSRRLYSAKQQGLGVAIRDGHEEDCLYYLSQSVPLSSSASICGKCEPLIESLNWRQPHIALTLVERGAKLNGITCPEHSCKNYTAIHYCARYNFSSVLEKLIDQCPSLLFVASEIHPIYMAIANNSNDCLQIMLGKSKEAWQRSIGTSPTSSTAFDVAHFNGALPETQIQPDRCRGFALIQAADLTKVATLRPGTDSWQLSESLSASAISMSMFRSPLHFAARLGNTEAATTLLNYGASVNSFSEFKQETPLHLALEGSSSAMIELLLDRGASLNSRNWIGTTCASLVVSSPLRDLPDRIRSKAAKLVQPNIFGRLPYFYWSGSNYLPMYAARADNSLSLAAFDTLGDSPLLAVWRSDSIALQTYVLNLDIDIGGIDNTFGSALHFCWINDNISTLRRLLKRLGQSLSRKMLNFKPQSQLTPLYFAAAADQLKTMELMLNYGANKDVIGGSEGTALMVAAAYGRENIVTFLVRLGALTSYFDDGTNTTISVFDKAKDFPAIQRWLLVDRWIEMKSIEWR